ncbi:MAG: class I SAM-dependent methyltransferase [Rhodanobacteraceae bacterium]|nr:class I SAM-dependent methyltransferase [Rhodanobacteraceae bacterium]
MQAKHHWQQVYLTKAADRVSWFQPLAETSLRLIRDSGIARSAPIIDVGGGASTLVDGLIAAGYANLTVLDLSAAALAAARARLGPPGDRVHWQEADILNADLPAQAYELWHDRAAFHFLTEASAREAYVRQVMHALKPGGHLILATFAEDGPTQCSGLPICRYSAAGLQAEFGAAFVRKHHEYEAHMTPSGNMQKFVYCTFSFS